MNTLSAAGQIRAFFRAKWVELLFAIPAGIAASTVYEAMTPFFIPNDVHARQIFESAVRSSASDIGFVAIFGAVAFPRSALARPERPSKIINNT